MDVNDSLLPFTRQSHKLKCLSRPGDVEEIEGGCCRSISAEHKEMASYTDLATEALSVHMVGTPGAVNVLRGGLKPYLTCFPSHFP